MTEERGALPHEEAIGMLDDLAEGELDEADAVRVQAHLAGCERCRAVQAALGGGLDAAVSVAPIQVPDLLPGVQRRLRLRSRGRFYGADDARRGHSSPWPLLIGSVALLLGLAIAYILVGQMGGAGAGASPSSSGAPP